MGKSERRQRVLAWSGTRKDLQNLLDAIEAILAPVRDPRRAELEAARSAAVDQYVAWIDESETWLADHPDETTDERVDVLVETRRRHEKRLVDYPDHLKEAQDERLSRLAMFDEAWSIRLRIVDKFGTSDESAPHASELAERVDPRTFRSFSILVPVGFYGGAGDYAISVEPGSTGVTYSVVSPDSRFTKSAVAELREELMKSRPWWSFLSNYVVNICVLGPIFGAIFFLGLSGDSSGSAAFIGGAVSAVVGFGWASLAASVARWIMPPTGILSGSGRSRTGPVIVWLVTLAASIPIGLLVNQWSSGGQ